MPFTPPSMGYSGIPDYTFRKSSSPFSHNLETAPGSNTFVWKAPPVAPPPNALSAEDIQAVRGAFASKGIDPFPWFGQGNNAPPPIPGTGSGTGQRIDYGAIEHEVSPEDYASHYGGGRPQPVQQSPSIDYAPGYGGPQPGNPTPGIGNPLNNAANQFQGNLGGNPQSPIPSLPGVNPGGFQSPLGNYEYPFKQGAKSPQYPF